MKTSKILLPLATLVAAGAIAVGSGATFSSESSNTISSVTSGTLTQTNSKGTEAILSADNMKPGDSKTGEVTITNTGSLASNFSLEQTAAQNPFGKYMTLTVKKKGETTDLYSGQLGQMQKTTLEKFAAKTGTNTYVFTVALALDTPNEEGGTSFQGKTASAGFKWTATQDLTPSNQ